MTDILVYPAGTGGAAPFAAAYLAEAGVRLIDHPSPEVTHLLLDVPCREIPVGLLDRLPEPVTVVGGKLDRTELAFCRRLDLLRHEGYLAQNAAITAECALRVAASRMQTVFSGANVLVIGWGRIGKCLAELLKAVGCRVTVAARKAADLAMLDALGYQPSETGNIAHPEQYALIFNTVPSPVLGKNILSRCPKTLKIDLASSPGLEGPDVIWARGLPGLYAPESSGKLIAETFLKEVAI